MMISIIIPIGPKDEFPSRLLENLGQLPFEHEIILGLPHGRHLDIDASYNIRLVHGEAGRASQMNAAAREAAGEFLWFIHADSLFAADASFKLVSAIKSDPSVLYYHDLIFMDDGPKAVHLNARLVRWRSDFLRLPFGDQAFLLPTKVFVQLGFYDETVTYGEDYMLVWKAHQHGIRVRGTGGSVWTSARKYEAGGWAKVTALHVYLTIKQGVPQFFKVLWSRIK